MIRNTHVVMLTSALRMVPLSTQLVVSGSRKCPSYLAVPGLFPKDPKKNEQFSEGALPAVTDSFKAVVNRPDSTPDTVKVLSDSTCENSGTLNGFKFVVRSHPKTKQTINLEFIISARDVGVFQRLKLLENPTNRDCISAIILWWSIGMLKDVTLVYIYIYMCKPGPSMNLVSLSPQKIARLNDGQENIQGNRSPAIQGFSWHKRNLIAIELWVHQFKESSSKKSGIDTGKKPESNIKQAK